MHVLDSKQMFQDPGHDFSYNLDFDNFQRRHNLNFQLNDSLGESSKKQY